MDTKKIKLIFLYLVVVSSLSGCASKIELMRDYKDRIYRVKYTGNQKIKVDVKNEVVEADNKRDMKMVDLNLSKVGT